MIDQRCVDFCQRLKSNIKSQPNHTLKIDAGKQLEYLSLDIITKACLGHELGCVAINNDKHGFLNTVESGQTMCEQLAILPEITKLLSWLTRIPFIKSLVTPNCKDSTGPGRIMGVCSSCSLPKAELTFLFARLSSKSSSSAIAKSTLLETACSILGFETESRQKKSIRKWW